MRTKTESISARPVLSVTTTDRVITLNNRST